ncbi:MAG: hypothetical protein M8867_01910 [marine benthic group bacterium]|nr:hypothetical protein [Gemmatimonadota bacterium]
MGSTWISDFASSSRFHFALLGLSIGCVACSGDDGQSRPPGAADATSVVADTIEGVLTVHHEGLSLRRCGDSGASWVLEAPGADLSDAAADLGARAGDRLRARVRGEVVTAPADGAGSEYESAIRAVQWVYLAEDVSDCPPGEETTVEATRRPGDEILRTGDAESVELASRRFQSLASRSIAGDTVQGSFEQGDATSNFTAYFNAAGQVVRVEERLDLAEYGSRTVEYGLSAGSPFFIREAGTLRDLSAEGAEALVPRGYEAALDPGGSVLGSNRYGPGFESGMEAVVGGARAHLDSLLERVEERVAGRVPTG